MMILLLMVQIIGKFSPLIFSSLNFPNLVSFEKKQWLNRIDNNVTRSNETTDAILKVTFAKGIILQSLESIV